MDNVVSNSFEHKVEEILEKCKFIHYVGEEKYPIRLINEDKAIEQLTILIDCSNEKAYYKGEEVGRNELITFIDKLKQSIEEVDTTKKVIGG